MHLQPLVPANPVHRAALVAIWNAACGADLAITERLAAYNTHPATGALQAGQIAFENDQPVGFVLATALPADPQTSPPHVGWIDALAVLGNYQKRGIGSALVAWAENFLRAQGCTRVRLGGGLRPFAPGLPMQLDTTAFFTQRGFAPRGNEPHVCDVARDLGDYVSAHANVDAMLRPARATDADALGEFFHREFPGRWRFEFDEFLRERGRASDYLLLLTERGVDGFARVTFENSERPIERFYPQRLPRPWGQLGPIGVSRDTRGKGFGGALLDAGLQYLRDHDVRGCVIDWTSLVDFYGKFGFAPYREYLILMKGEKT